MSMLLILQAPNAKTEIFIVIAKVNISAITAHAHTDSITTIVLSRAPKESAANLNP